MNRQEEARKLADRYRGSDLHPGAWSGKMGSCLLFYHLFRHSGAEEDEQEADRLLNELTDDMSWVRRLELKEGLVGSGCVLAHLLREGFIAGDADELLEEFDYWVFNVVYDRRAPLMECVEVGLYYICRLRWREGEETDLPALVLRQNIISLLDSMDEAVPENGEIKAEEYPWVLYVLYELELLDVFNYKVQKIRARLRAYDPEMQKKGIPSVYAWMLEVVKYRTGEGEMPDPGHLSLIVPDKDEYVMWATLARLISGMEMPLPQVRELNAAPLLGGIVYLL